KGREGINKNIDDEKDIIKANNEDIERNYIKNEEIEYLKSQIAYLSKLQRQIVIMYYYQGKKQDEISTLLDIPKGTVKWHLFEAKKELKKGMESMNNRIAELKFNPIKFSYMGVNGCIGSEGGTSKFFKSTLAQNIVYCVYKEGKTINEIADLLGVSPVYIESEVEYLEEYSFLIKLPGNKYISNMIIDEVTQEILDLSDDMYKKASKIIANEIFDEVMKSDLLNSESIYYPDEDKNFLMWTLVLYIIAQANSENDANIKFEELATIRKDGGCYIASASIDNLGLKMPDIFKYRDNWCGPMWNEQDKTILWEINSKWSSKDINIDTYEDRAKYDIGLLNRYVSKGDLSSEEFSYLAGKGYIKGSIGQDKLNIVWIKDRKTIEALLNIGYKVKLRYKEELKSIKAKYVKAVLESTPKHLRKTREYELQDIFRANGVFLLYSVVELLESKRLEEINDEYKKKSLKTMLLGYGNLE
ncbi:MAG: RNA polymerase sigma factor, partial [Paraclostridium sp.]